VVERIGPRCGCAQRRTTRRLLAGLSRAVKPNAVCAHAENAALFAANTLPILEAIRATGVTDLRGTPLLSMRVVFANARGVRTARGGR
jgi:hypothetical protein